VVNRKFNGVDIGDSAVEFFEKLAKLESGGKYNLADQKYLRFSKAIRPLLI